MFKSKSRKLSDEILCVCLCACVCEKERERESLTRTTKLVEAYKARKKNKARKNGMSQQRSETRLQFVTACSVRSSCSHLFVSPFHAGEIRGSRWDDLGRSCSDSTNSKSRRRRWAPYFLFFRRPLRAKVNKTGLLQARATEPNSTHALTLLIRHARDSLQIDSNASHHEIRASNASSKRNQRETWYARFELQISRWLMSADCFFKFFYDLV